MFKKIGKPSNGILDYQSYLIQKINQHIADENKFEKNYLKSLKRKRCIICETAIGPSDFSRNKIEFSFCSKCGHLNGHHELTNDLMNDTYNLLSQVSTPYDKIYIQEIETFKKAVEEIYSPKCKFLIESLSKQVSEEEVKQLKILDFGTGSGHLVAALNQIGFLNVTGIDPMLTTITYASNVLGIKGLKRVSIEESTTYLKDTDAQIVSMICTLPHISNHNEVLSTMAQNPNILYTFQKVPMYSLASMLDVVNPETNSRVLSGAHTHLYSESSLKFIENRFSMERIAEWRFGADSLDIYRNIMINMLRNNYSKNLIEQFNNKFLPAIDDIQFVLDKYDFSSEIHLVWKFNR